MIEVRRSTDVQAFLADAGPFLAEREAHHNLLLGICSQLLRDPDPFGEGAAFLAIAEHDGRIAGAAVRTPPHNLVLSEIDDLAAIGLLVRETRRAFTALPGVLGPADASAAFVRTWCDVGGGVATRTMSNRIYRASVASQPHGVPGAMRAYHDDDRRIATRWFGAFVKEALPHEAVADSGEVMLRRRLDDPDGGIQLWELDGRPVSLAAFGSRTPHGIRVGPVYTPPDMRGKGYASALVARMTGGLLDGGHGFCFLFTDASNPTANRIYQRIGYEYVSEVDQYAIGETRSAR